MNEEIKAAYVSKAAAKLYPIMAKIREESSPTKEDVVYYVEWLLSYALAYEQECESDTIQTYDDDKCERMVLMHWGFLKTKCAEISRYNNCDYITALYKACTEVVFRPYFDDFWSHLALEMDLAQSTDYTEEVIHYDE